jgi:hypothetical protein
LVNAQNLYVIKVDGKVFVDEKELKTGDKLTRESMLRFTTVDDRLYLMSPSDGYFLLSPESHGNNQKDWIVAVKSALIPENKYYKTATRSSGAGIQSFEDIYDLMGFFRDRVLIVEPTAFLFNSGKIKLDENNKFEFINPEGKTIQCTTDGATFTLTGDFSDAVFEMNYNQNGEIKKIGNFVLTIEKRENMAKELAVFFENKRNTTNNYFKNVVPYINDAYGNTNMEVIINIITEDLKIPLNVKDF